MYYGFNTETKACLWSSTASVKSSDAVTVLQSDTKYSISDIYLDVDDDGNFSIAEKTTNPVDTIAEAQALKANYLEKAASVIDTLKDVVEFYPTEENQQKYKAWRKYRADVYGIDPTQAGEIEWPTQPEE